MRTYYLKTISSNFLFYRCINLLLPLFIFERCRFYQHLLFEFRLVLFSFIRILILFFLLFKFQVLLFHKCIKPKTSILKEEKMLSEIKSFYKHRLLLCKIPNNLVFLIKWNSQSRLLEVLVP